MTEHVAPRQEHISWQEDLLPAEEVFTAWLTLVGGKQAVKFYRTLLNGAEMLRWKEYTLTERGWKMVNQERAALKRYTRKFSHGQDEGEVK